MLPVYQNFIAVFKQHFQLVIRLKRGDDAMPENAVNNQVIQRKLGAHGIRLRALEGFPFNSQFPVRLDRRGLWLRRMRLSRFHRGAPPGVDGVRPERAGASATAGLTVI